VIRRPDMNVDYQDRLDFLYGRLNYEWLGMPKVDGGASPRTDAVSCSELLGDPHEVAPDHPTSREPRGRGSTSVDDRRGPHGPRASARACSARPTFTGWKSDSASMESSLRPTRLIAPDGRGTAGRREARRGVRRDSRYRGPDLLRDHDRDGPAPLREAGRRGRSSSRWEWGGGSTRRTSFHPELSVCHDHLIRPYPATGHEPWARSPPKKAGILQARSTLRSAAWVQPEAREAIPARGRTTALVPCTNSSVTSTTDTIPRRLRLTRTDRRPCFLVKTWRTKLGWSSNIPLLGAHSWPQNARGSPLASLDVFGRGKGWNVGRDAVVRGLRIAALACAGGGFPGRGPPGWSSTVRTTSRPAEGRWRRTLQSCFPPPRGGTLIFGTSRDKDLRGPAPGASASIRSIDRHAFTSKTRRSRATGTRVAWRGRSRHSNGRVGARGRPTPAVALAMARQRTAPDGLICVTGSLFPRRGKRRGP